MTKDPTLSLRVQWLGERLRKARKAAGYTLNEAADYLQLAANTVSRFERGTMRVRRSYIRDLIDFYGINQQHEREALLQLSEDAWRRDWWTGDTSDLDVEFLDYTWLEARASRICIYDPLLINGLLQTKQYAESIMASEPAATDEEQHRNRMVELRMQRQQIFETADPTKLALVLEEAPLRRHTGGPDVMRAQLQYLIHCNQQSHIDIRILPSTLGWHQALKGGPFTCFDMQDPYPDVGYVEGLVDRSFLEEQTKVARYRQAFKQLHDLAYTPRESNQVIQGLIEETR